MRKNGGKLIGQLTEAQIQIALVGWARLNPQISPFLYHVPNGGNRSPREAAKFKRMGVLAGVPDLFLSFPSKSHHGLYLELKRDGGKLSSAQKEFITRIKRVGYAAEVVRSVDEGIEIIGGYLDV